MDGTKRCGSCKTDKPIEAFGRNRTRKDGFQPHCKACAKVFHDRHRAKDPERAARQDARKFANRYGRHRGRAALMLNNARQRAKRAGVACTLAVAWIEERLDEGVCEATGLPLEFPQGRGKGHRANSFAPSLERQDPTGPYSSENVIVACWIYNRAKGAFPLGDFERMCRAVASRSTEQ